MKTYPTQHPNWIDVDPEPQLEKNTLRARLATIGLSFKWAFVIVLGFHIVLLCGIYAASSLKPKAGQPTASLEAPAIEEGPKSDALARNEWPQPNATPEVKALPPSPKKVLATAKPATGVRNPSVGISPSPNPAKAPKMTALKSTPTKAPAPKGEEIALKEKFLATKATTPQARADATTREQIPVPSSPQPLVAAMVPPSAPVKTNAASSSTTPVTEYTLSSGDNLYAVSRRLQVSYNELMEANGISDPRQLRIGQKLKVPERKLDTTCAL
jgi:LysM repeat protein